MTDREKDDFWDISKLVPKKEHTLTRFSSGQKTAPVTDGVPPSPKNEELRLTLTPSERTYTEEEYTPADNPFIERVRIRHFSDRYDFYDSFRRAATLYFDVPGTRCDFVPFYSYMPQYSQMTKEQKAYYFYWRDEVRHGRYIRSDYSYLYLYVYEIINLPDRISPKEGLELLCTLWREYRRALPRIDRYFSVWIQDYCLVYRLSPPAKKLSDFIYDVIPASTFREFYLSDLPTACESGVSTLVACLSDYDWHTARFATGESARGYRRHMEGALGYLMRHVFSVSRHLLASGRASVIVRDAFPSSLCTHSVKCRLEITYYPLSEAHGIREGVTAAVKYIENRLRAALGVKSRLSVKGLPDDYRAVVDFYFDTLFHDATKKKREENIPAYERQYDAPREELSFGGADKIESESWAVTRRLVSEAEEAEEQILPSAITGEETPAAGIRREDVFTVHAAKASVADEIAPVRMPEIATKTEVCASQELALAVLSALLDGDGGRAAALAKAAGVPLDSVVEGINEQALERIGDTVIEPSDGGYATVDDYREEIKEWLCKTGT